VLLVSNTPTLNNETISYDRIIMPIENNYGSISKIKSSSSYANPSIKSIQTSTWGLLVFAPNLLLTNIILIVPLP
jgi:hypothetical protein